MLDERVMARLKALEDRVEALEATGRDLVKVSIQSLRLGPEDILVVDMGDSPPITPEVAERVRVMMEGVGVPRGRVIVKPERVKLAVIRQDEGDTDAGSS